MMEQTDYLKYRGKCKEMSEAEVAKDPTLRLARGYYHCPYWGKQAHWWCVKPDGTIVDPSVNQFPTKGAAAEYEEYNGRIECEQCGKETTEEEATIDGHHVFCSGDCYARCVGF
ncbi:MAG: hypothetical protein KGJ90_06825 [Patescibacteria group bacterium]|nr:hypothetical protein [Patescibacteria group bacterium]